MPVSVKIKVRANKLPAGSYEVYVVDRYRDETGQVIGCSATPLGQALQVNAGSQTDYQGSLDRFRGHYDVQVCIGQLSGAGILSAPAAIDVP